jgi:hypothetical protein
MGRRTTAYVPKRSTKTYRDIRAIAVRYGYKYGGINNRGHLKWVRAGWPFVVTISKNSDVRVMKNVEALFRRYASLGNQKNNQSGNHAAV